VNNEPFDIPTPTIEKRKGRGWTKPRGLDRPVVGIVGLDPAYVGKGGLCVLPNPALKPGAQLAWRQAQIVDEATFKWLGEACAALCRPGERVLLVALNTAFRNRAWGLGKSVGAIEGLLLDLHATEPETIVEVADTTVRHALGIRVKGRDALKRRAVTEVMKRYGITIPADAAEATLAATWGLMQMQEGSE
jgi:hypothetical protein